MITERIVLEKICLGFVGESDRAVESFVERGEDLLLHVCGWRPVGFLASAVRKGVPLAPEAEQSELDEADARVSVVARP